MNRAAAVRAIVAASLLSIGAARADVDADMARGVVAYERGDIVAALQAFRSAAEQGHARAQLRLARLLHRSDQAPAALPWYRRAADQRDAEARFALGQLYLTGEAGEKSLPLGRAWIFAAAADDYPAALRALVTGYEQGRMGLPIDPELARWWRTRLDGAETGRAAERSRHAAENTETEVDDVPR